MYKLISMVGFIGLVGCGGASTTSTPPVPLFSGSQAATSSTGYATATSTVTRGSNFVVPAATFFQADANGELSLAQLPFEMTIAADAQSVTVTIDG